MFDVSTFAPVQLAPVLLSLLALVYIARHTVIRRHQDIESLPGPSRKDATWLWGHELLAFENCPTDMYTRWAAAFGTFFKIKGAFFHRDIVSSNVHRMAEYSVHRLADLKETGMREVAGTILGRGIVWAEGQEHTKQRRLLAPAFSPEAIKGMTDDISESSAKLESRLTNLVLARGVTVNVADYISMCTLDIIGRIGFGHDFKSGQSAEAKEIRAVWEKQVNASNTFKAFVGSLLLRTFPILTSLPLPVMKEARRTREIVSELATRLLRHGYFSDKGRDILSILMCAGNKDGAKEKLSATEIVDNITTFLLVGHETTAGSLSFILWELARHPEIQQKLRGEIRQFGGNINYDDIQQLSYLDAVVKEGLRLHPASPMTERVALKDDVIPLNKPVCTSNGQTVSSISVKAGQVFHIPFVSMQVNTDVWGPNAAEFVPERWIDPGGVLPPAELPHGWSGLVAFCDGPRNCIGYRLAVFEFKVILATLIRTLELHDTSANVELKIKPTLQAFVDGRGGFLPIHVTLAP
ncbi:cytochrome P450 [Sparassis latifolia]